MADGTRAWQYRPCTPYSSRLSVSHDTGRTSDPLSLSRPSCGFVSILTCVSFNTAFHPPSPRPALLSFPSLDSHENSRHTQSDTDPFLLAFSIPNAEPHIQPPEIHCRPHGETMPRGQAPSTAVLLRLLVSSFPDARLSGSLITLLSNAYYMDMLHHPSPPFPHPPD